MNPSSTESIVDINHLSGRLRELQGEAEALLTTLDQTSSEVGAELRTQLSARPYAVLAAAAGLGYLLGGGVPSRFTRLLVVLGGRVGFELLSREIGSRAAQRFTNGMRSSAAQTSERNGS